MKEAGKKRLILFSSIALAIILLDQAIKFLVSRKIPLNDSIPLLENIFHLTYSQNYGAAFSILQGQTWLFILVAIFFVVLIALNYKKIPADSQIQIAFAIFLGGTISNLIDRLLFGYVIDYFEFKIFFFSNNISDIAITFGALIIVLYFLLKKK